MGRPGQEFKKILGFWDSVVIVLAIVIGAGIFRVPAEVAAYLNSGWLIMLAWAAAGIIVFCGTLCYAELSAALPETGGNYIYFKASYGKWLAFLFGWSELTVIRTGSIAAVAFVSAEYLRSFFSFDEFFIKPAAVTIVLLISAVNIFGLHYARNLQRILTAVIVIKLLSVIFLGITSGKGSFAHFFSTAPAPVNTIPAFGLALIPILWTYGGWHESTFMAGETKEPQKVLPAALLTALGLVILFYLALNFLYIYLIPVAEIARLKLIGSNVLEIICGPAGKKIFEALVIISSVGCVNAMIITGSRITYAMAQDNSFFKYLSGINPVSGGPSRAVIINALWSVVLIWLGAFNKLLFFTGILVWLFFGLAGISIFILRKKFPHSQRPYKMRGYPLVPAVFIVACIFLFLNTFLFSLSTSLCGLLLLAGGIPVYIISQKLSKA